MKEVLYTISGKRLPVVMNIGARALTSQGLNVHAGHDDVMSVADCGWGMIFGRNAQEAGDFCLISRRAAEATQTPFFNVQDGFLTTHTVETVRLPEPEFMKEYIGDPREKLVNLMDPANPLMSGVVQNQDSYMKGKIAQRWYYQQVEPALENAFAEFARKTGRRYDFLEPYRCDDAEYILVGMGCYMETAKATVDYLRDGARDRRRLPDRVRLPAVPGPAARRGAQGLPGGHRLRADGRPALDHGQPPDPRAQGGVLRRRQRPERPGPDRRRSRGSTAPPPAWAAATSGPATSSPRSENMIDDGPDYFCVGIDHPLALKCAEDPDLRPHGGFSMRGHSVGGFGSVTTNKVIATIAGDVFGKDVQAYPKYGSEKKGLPTTYYLTIADSHINTHCELEHVDLVCINDPTAILSAEPLKGHGPRRGDLHAVALRRPGRGLDADPRASTGGRSATRTSASTTPTWSRSRARSPRSPTSRCACRGSSCWARSCKLTPYARQSEMTDEQVYAGVEKALRKYFGKRGDRVVQDNLTCVKRGYSEMKEVPAELIQLTSEVVPSAIR